MVRIRRTLCRWLGPVVSVGRRNLYYPPPSHQKCSRKCNCQNRTLEPNVLLTDFLQLRHMKNLNRAICKQLNEKLVEINNLKAEKLDLDARVIELERKLQKSTRNSLYRNKMDEIQSQTEQMRENVKKFANEIQASLHTLQNTLDIKLDADSSVNRLSEATPSNQRRKLDEIDKENRRRESFTNKKFGHLKTNIDPTIPIGLMTPIMEFSNEYSDRSRSVAASTPKLDESRPKRTPQRAIAAHDLSIFDYEPVIRESTGSDTLSPDQIIRPSFLAHESFIEQIGGSSFSPVIKHRSTKKKETSVNSVRSENSAVSTDTFANSSLDTSVNRSIRPARKAKANVNYAEPPSARKVRQGDPFWCRN